MNNFAHAHVFAANATQHAATRRPELRVLTTATSVATAMSSPVETPPDSAFTTSPMPDTPYTMTPPFSAVSGSSPLLPEAPLTVPRSRAQSLQAPRRAIYPPPVLPQLLPDAARHLTDSSPTSSSSTTTSPDTTNALEASRGRRGARLSKSSSLPSCLSPEGSASASPTARLSHPYARIYARKAAAPSTKRRKMWNHALERELFTPEEIVNLGAPNRRAIYTASLEHHIDALHAQLHALDMYPVPLEDLGQYRGLNSKTAKSMVAGLHKDSCDLNTQLMELRRATEGLYRTYEQKTASSTATDDASMQRRHSVATASYVYPNLFVGPSGSNVPTTTMS